MHTNKQSSYSKLGFTLIELSIVLVLIGLIVGSIVVGGTIVRSSQIQSIVTDSERYIEAAKQFKEKYGYLPGDFSNAQNYWGANSACTGTSITATQTTCNGNGDGIIGGDGLGTYSAGNTSYYEMWYAWQHLADAGLIQGSYSGLNGPSGSNTAPDNRPDYNVPQTKIKGGGFAWEYWNGTTIAAANGCTSGVTVTGCFFNPKPYQQYLVIGQNAVGYTLFGVLLSPSEAATIDSKMDDGLAVSGLLTSNNTQLTPSSPCTTTDSVTTAVYSTMNVGTSSGSKSLGCVLLLEVDW